MEQFQNDTLSELHDLLLLTQVEMAKLTAESDGVVQSAKDSLFRSFHTIKGVAGLAGLQDLCQLSSQLESLFNYLRLGQVLLSVKVFQLVEECLVKLQKSLEPEIPEQLGIIVDLADLSKQIQQELAKKIDVELTDEEKTRLLAKANIKPVIVATFLEYEEIRLFETLKSDKGLRKIRVSCNSVDFGDDKLPQLTQTIRDKKLGEIIAIFPDSEMFTATEMVFCIFLGSGLPEDLILESLAEFQVTIEQDFSFTDEAMPWGLD